jgi:hypothetical protein
MKRIWIVLLALVTVLAIAAPAAGKGKPGKTTTSAPIAVFLEGGPIWVHEAGDVIHYTVVIENKTRSDVTVGVEFEFGSEPAVMIPARATVTLADLFSTSVGTNRIEAARTAGCENQPAGADPQCEIPASVTVVYGGGEGEVVAQTSSKVMPYDLCGFAPAVVAGGEVCIWQPDPTNQKRWTVSVEPDATKRTNVLVTVRDHVPGNWCTLPLPEGGGGVVSQRWKPADGPVTLKVYLGNEEGICLSGGAGGDHFAVGNGASFYLYLSTDGEVTVSPG